MQIYKMCGFDLNSCNLVYVMIPLAERMRPKTLDAYIGQKHLLAPGKPLHDLLIQGHIPSLIFWGPPGVGKTTLAHIMARTLNRPFYALSAVQSGVKEVREIIEESRKKNLFSSASPILFIDEIHRFSKSQQDALLMAVELGQITLIGATTENPSFEVISALLSRCQVYVLQPLTAADLLEILHQCITTDTYVISRHVDLKETDALLKASGGDARRLLNAFELALNSSTSSNVEITNACIETLIQNLTTRYDKTGEQHYDLSSALIKSIRGSDPNAAIYYMARMLHGGEDPLFIARRLIILASEDIGNANPNALVLAQSCFNAVHQIGMPEARIILSQCVLYLACAAKSNSAYLAIDAALSECNSSGDLPVPLELRNPVSGLMKQLDYGQNYAYAHNHPNNFYNMEFLPEAIAGTRFYSPGENPKEQDFQSRLKNLWGKKYNY
jgi:putative ATPase